LEEVLETLIDAYGFDREEIECIRKERRDTRGGFTNRIFLERIEDA
ncbi:phosphoribosyl-ATP pyrophosphohydrolase, partial [Candidatus Jorgensenbacteria bacterium]|nr:phosphoribosyl-ATP pyrophosphohydrolase [Candidatus Jorgensenbacteria bacterium]